MVELTPRLAAIVAVDVAALVLIWGFLVGGFVPDIGFWIGAGLGIFGFWAFGKERVAQAEAKAEEE